jgi:hypothetical protein
LQAALLMSAPYKYHQKSVDWDEASDVRRRFVAKGQRLAKFCRQRSAASSFSKSNMPLQAWHT